MEEKTALDLISSEVSIKKTSPSDVDLSICIDTTGLNLSGPSLKNAASCKSTPNVPSSNSWPYTNHKDLATTQMVFLDYPLIKI